MASMTEELNFCFYFILINLNLNSHAWLMRAALDCAGLCLKIVGGHVKGFSKGRINMITVVSGYLMKNELGRERECFCSGPEKRTGCLGWV